MNARVELNPLAVTSAPLLRLHPAQLRPNPLNPRKAFARSDLEALAQSIAERGIVQPLLVRPLSPLPFDDDAYPGEAHIIIAGERRWRASMLIAEAGELPDGFFIPARIGTHDDEIEELETAAVENMQRVDLNHMEIGQVCEQLARAGRSNREIATTIGRTPEFVQQHRRLTELDPSEQASVAAGALSLHDALRYVRSMRAPAVPEPEQTALDLPPKPETAGPTVTGPFVVNGVDYHNATRAQEARYAQGIDQRPDAASGKNAPAPNPEPARSDPDAFDASPVQRRVLIELAHSVARARVALDPDAEWTGDTARDLVTHGAEVGKFWTDSVHSALVAARMVRMQMRSGKPPVAALTARAIDWFVARAIALPITLIALGEAQIEADGRESVGLYRTPWLATIIETPAATESLALVDDHEDGLDCWGRNADTVAADEKLRQRVVAFVNGEGGEGDSFSALLRDCGVFEDVQVSDGALLCMSAEGVPHEFADVDVNREGPNEIADAVALLIAFAVNRLLDGEGAK